MNDRVRARHIVTILFAIAIVLSAVLTSCGGSSSKGASTNSTESATKSSTATAAPTTTTTVDPGTLPQTDEKPSGTGPAFEARMATLADAIIHNTPDTAISTFFPVSAYKQTKKNTDPAADWKNRLIANFRVDVADANKKLGPNAKNAVFTGATVPNTAVWVKPGEEYNVGPYWRVFKTQLNFTVDGRNVQIPIESMISWRGQWYVVHLGTIR